MNVVPSRMSYIQLHLKAIQFSHVDCFPNQLATLRLEGVYYSPQIQE